MSLSVSLCINIKTHIMGDYYSPRIRNQQTSVRYEKPPKNTGMGLLIAIIIVGIILAVLVVLLIYFLVFRPASSGGGSTSPGTLGNACSSTGQCVTPLICDTDNICKADVGNSCTKDEQCISGSICSGGFCSLEYGETCINSLDCAAPGKCVNSKCTTLGLACVDDNSCVMPGITTAEIGCNSETGTCAVRVGQDCNTVDDCLGGGTTVQCDTSLNPPQCRSLPGQACTSTDQCLNNAQCTLNVCGFPTCINDASCSGAGGLCANKKCIPPTCTSTSQCTGDYQLGAGWACYTSVCGGVQTCTSQGFHLEFCPDEGPTILANKVANGMPCNASVECESGNCNQSNPQGICV